MARKCLEITLDALEWRKLVRSGDWVAWGQASAEPTSLTASLLTARAAVGGFRAFAGICWSASMDPGHADHVAFTSYCGTGRNHRMGASLDILPAPYGELAATIGDHAPILLLKLAPGRDAGHFGYGAAADYTADLIDRARLVIAEVDETAPRTGAGQEIARERVDIIVRTHSLLPVPDNAQAGEAEWAIARHVAERIEDGSTLQIGLGGVPAAILGRLRHHRDLGLHSGMIIDEVVTLADQGALTNARKTIDRHISVTGLLAGSERLMCWADRNNALALRPTSYTHNPEILASIDRFVALNSAIEVDLTGQVNAEVANGQYLGAVGGAATFLRAAQASRGGLPIIALPATAGTKSRIVARLSGPVSTTRADSGLIVTEHGVADLRGLGLKARREAMLAIAAPMHRASLDHDLSQG